VPNPIYLDHAATTPVRREVRDAMLPFLGDEAFGNPSSAHRFGRQVRAAVEAARERVAAAVGAAIPAGSILSSPLPSGRKASLQAQPLA